MNGRFQDVRTSVHEVTFNGHLEVLKYLVEKLNTNGIAEEINAIDEAPWTPLHSSCQGGENDVVKFLLDTGVSITAKNVAVDMPIHTAASNGRVEVVELLVRRGAVIVSLDSKNYTHRASQNGQLHVVKQLLECGARVNVTAQGGATALYLASREDQLPEVQALTTAGANCSLCDARSRSALEYTREERHYDIDQLMSSTQFVRC